MERHKDRIVMSQYERDVLNIMAPVLHGKRTQAEAARLLKLTERQVRRIQRRLESEGDAAVVLPIQTGPFGRTVAGVT